MPSNHKNGQGAVTALRRASTSTISNLNRVPLSQNKAITKAAHVGKPRAASAARNLLLHYVKNELLLCVPKQADPTLQKMSYCVYHHHLLIAKVFMPYWGKPFKTLMACPTYKPRCFRCCCTSVAQLSHFKIGITATRILFPHESAFARLYMFIHVHTCKIGQRVHIGFI